MQPSERNAKALSFLRLAVGALFLIFGEYKVTGPTFVREGFAGWIHRFLDGGSAYPFMRPLLQGFVLSHPTPLALLVGIGEVAIGLSLLLDALVPWASAAGVVYMLTLMFSANYPGPGSPMWAYFGAALDHLVFALCFAAFLVGQPHVWSVAAYLRARRARGITTA